jgi:[ribosomal protein S18]-alanine N-acetyltransferase
MAAVPDAARTVHGRSGEQPAGRSATIRPLETAHLDQVLGIERAAYPRPWSAAAFAAELARDDRCYLVAFEGDEVVGYAGLSVGAGEAHVLTVAVVPSRRRRGHGRRLVSALLQEAVARGATAVTLEVRASDVSAQQLYRRAGFVAAGVRPGYYQDDGEGALIMWWHDDDRGR